VQLHLSRPR